MHKEKSTLNQTPNLNLHTAILYTRLLQCFMWNLLL